MTNDEAALHFDRKELLTMCRDKIANGEANAWIKAYYIGNRHLEEVFPSLAELKSPPPPETQEGGSLPTVEQFS